MFTVVEVEFTVTIIKLQLSHWIGGVSKTIDFERHKITKKDRLLYR